MLINYEKNLFPNDFFNNVFYIVPGFAKKCEVWIKLQHFILGHNAENVFYLNNFYYT